MERWERSSCTQGFYFKKLPLFLNLQLHLAAALRILLQSSQLHFAIKYSFFIRLLKTWSVGSVAAALRTSTLRNYLYFWVYSCTQDSTLEFTAALCYKIQFFYQTLENKERWERSSCTQDFYFKKLPLFLGLQLHLAAALRILLQSLQLHFAIKYSFFIRLLKTWSVGSVAAALRTSNLRNYLYFGVYSCTQQLHLGFYFRVYSCTLL